MRLKEHADDSSEWEVQHLHVQLSAGLVLGRLAQPAGTQRLPCRCRLVLSQSLCPPHSAPLALSQMFQLCLYTV